LELEDLFEFLNIQIDDLASIGEYYLYSFSNLEEEQKDILTQLEQKIGFKEIKDGIFYSPENQIATMDAMEFIKPVFEEKQRLLWVDAINEITHANDRCASSAQGFPIKPSLTHYTIITRWMGKCADTEDKFKSFINDLNLMFRESTKDGGSFKIPKDFRAKNDFWKCVYSIRNYYFHDKEQQDSQEKMKTIERAKKGFQIIIGEDFPSEHNPLDFIKAQIRLLEMAKDFLQNLVIYLKGCK